jgi:hypothetical protein
MKNDVVLSKYRPIQWNIQKKKGTMEYNIRNMRKSAIMLLHHFWMEFSICQKNNGCRSITRLARVKRAIENTKAFLLSSANL